MRFNPNRGEYNLYCYNLLTKGILNSHLAEVQQRASELEETLVKQMAQKAGLTEQMKAEDMMKWVRLMNNIRNSAQEIVKNQVIFAYRQSADLYPVQYSRRYYPNTNPLHEVPYISWTSLSNRSYS